MWDAYKAVQEAFNHSKMPVFCTASHSYPKSTNSRLATVSSTPFTTTFQNLRRPSLPTGGGWTVVCLEYGAIINKLSIKTKTLSETNFHVQSTTMTVPNALVA